MNASELWSERNKTAAGLNSGHYREMCAAIVIREEERGWKKYAQFP